MSDLFTDRGAIMGFQDACRFVAWYVWDRSLPIAAWLCGNPSTMNAEKFDPTGRRITHFTKAAGCGGWYLGNVHSLRTPYPAELWKMLKTWPKVGTAAVENLEYLRDIRDKADVHFVAFGAEAARRNPALVKLTLDTFLEDVPHPLCLGTNPDGWPLQPLARGKFAIPNTRKPVLWKAPA